MLQFSANIGFLWADRPLTARIAAAARAGFKAVEMHWPYEVPAADIAAAARAHAIRLLGINTAPGRLDAGERGLGALPGREREFLRSIDQALEYCRLSGATAIHAMAGNAPDARRSSAREVFAGNLRVAAAKAAAQDITLLLEPLNPTDSPGYFYATLDAATSLIEELDLPNIKLQFDVYQVARSEGDVLMRMRKAWPHIGNVQIAGVPARAEPDAGEIAYPAIFAALEESGYTGWIGCEYRPRGDTDAGLGWMTAMGVTT